MIDEITIYLWLSWNFQNKKSIRRKWNSLVDLSKYIYIQQQKKKKKKLGAIILSAIILPKVLLLKKFNGQRHQIYAQINTSSKPRE